MFGVGARRVCGVIARGGLAVSVGAVLLQKSASCEGDKNTAFVFIKPHANTAGAQKLVKSTLAAKGLTITQEGELTAAEIDKGMLIDQHYYSIASKASILAPKDMNVPADKFEKEFGLPFAKALEAGVVYNALEACKVLGVDAAGLDKLWAKAKKSKFGGGFYCGLVEVPGKKPIYVFNGFFMAMRAKFVTPGTSIHYYVVEFDPAKLSWTDFRGKLLGPTDPKDAPEGALRGTIYKDWKALGLAEVPNVGDNGVHASASPFESLAERMNWLKVKPEADAFGAALIKAGVSAETIKAWSVDPQVNGKSLFDSLEDLDSTPCIAKAASLAPKAKSWFAKFW